MVELGPLETKLLEEHGYEVRKYSGAESPTYAEVFEKMHGFDYYTLNY